MFRNIFQGVKNIKYFFPVIWNDRDWDDWYIYELLHVKLKKMGRYFENSPWLDDTEKDQICIEIKEAIVLCERILCYDEYGICRFVDEDGNVPCVDICENENNANKFWDYIKDHISNWWE